VPDPLAAVTAPTLARPARAGLHAYLDVLAGDARAGYLQIRYRTRRSVASLYYPPRGRRRSLEEAVTNLGRRTDVFVGCALRRDKRNEKDAIGEAWTLWADFDSATASEQLDGFHAPPTLLISSGTPGHLHAYWALQAPVDVDSVEDANRRLARALGGDPVTFEAARTLRPPETFNHKHDPPRPVVLEHARLGSRYRLEDVIGVLPPPPPKSTAVPPRVDFERYRGRDWLREIPPTVYVPRLLDTELGIDSKVACPFHEDRTPSLHAYPTAERGWFAFCCRRGGSIYDLAGALWGMDTKGEEFIQLKALLTERMR
jgi:hypothetical protein